MTWLVSRSVHHASTFGISYRTLKKTAEERDNFNELGGAAGTPEDIGSPVDVNATDYEDEEAPQWPSTVCIISGVSSQVVQSLFYSPALLAFAFAVFAFALPSGLSACLLLLSLYQLLISPQTGVQPLTSQADSLLVMIAGWFLVSYCVVASGVSELLPGFLQALICTTHARSVELGPLLPLATTVSFAFVMLAVAAHSRAHSAGHLWPQIRERAHINNFNNATTPDATSRMHADGHAHALLPQSPTSPSPLTPPDPHDASKQLNSAADVTLSLIAHTIGNAAVPVLWFTLAMFRLCPAGIFYAVGPALEVLPFQALTAVSEEPRSLALSRHRLMRSYAALHIALLYCLGLMPESHMPRWASAARGLLAGTFPRPPAPPISVLELTCPLLHLRFVSFNTLLAANIGLELFAFSHCNIYVLATVDGEVNPSWSRW